MTYVFSALVYKALWFYYLLLSTYRKHPGLKTQGLSGRLLIPTWGLPVTLLQTSPSTAHWGPGGQGQALCSGQEGPGLRQVIPCEVHVRGCGTRSSGYPGVVPGPRLVGIELATSRGLCRTHGDVKVHPASKQELPVSLQPEATSHRIARKSAMPPRKAW